MTAPSEKSPQTRNDMPPNPIFWSLLGLVTVGYVATLWYLYSRDRRDGEGFHSGRVPGYSHTSGRNVGLDASVLPLEGGDWMPLRLETLHGNERTRLVFSILFETQQDDPEGVRTFLRELVEMLQNQSEADVVYIQASAEDELGGRWDYLYAPDGKGWWGQEPVRDAYRSPLESAQIEVDAPAV